MSLAPKNQVLKNQREQVLAAVTNGNSTAGAIVKAIFGDGPSFKEMRVVDRALQYWRKAGKLVFRTVKQAKKGKPAGWSVK